MSDVGIAGVDLQMAVDVYREDRIVAAIVDHIASREREPKNGETRVRVVRKGLVLSREVTAEELALALEKLAAAGCGEFRVGRPREESRLIWRPGVSTIRLAEQIRSASGGVADQTTSQDAEPYEEHLFPVRPGVRMPLRIRSDLSADELDNLAEFVRVIARSRRR